MSQVTVFDAIFVATFLSKGEGVPPCCECPSTLSLTMNLSLPSSVYILENLLDKLNSILLNTNEPFQEVNVVIWISLLID